MPPNGIQRIKQAYTVRQFQHRGIFFAVFATFYLKKLSTSDDVIKYCGVCVTCVDEEAILDIAHH